MPYLPDEDRKRLLDERPDDAVNPGELNYVLTRRAIQYLETRQVGGGIRYGDLAEVVGAFEAAKLEFVRRVMAPYENTKIEQNGDVYNELLDRMGLLPVQPFRAPNGT